MKKLFGMLFCTIMLIAYANAQQVDSSDNYYFVKEKLENYYDDLIQRYGEDSLEGKDYKRFLRWKWFMEKRHGTGGSLSSYSEAINANLRTVDSSINSVPWELIGPVGVPADYDGELESSRGKGMIISIHVNPNNMSKIYAGGHHGGLFYTDDGGYTWQHLTKDYPEIKGVQSIVVHPDSDSIIFIVTHNWMSNHSRGMFKSTDKGNSWQEVPIIIGGDNFYPSNYKEREPKKLIMHPDSSNIMYLLTICHILKTDDGGLSWEEVFHESFHWWGMKDSIVNDSCNGDYDCVMGLRQQEGLKDIAFDTYDPSTIYAVGHVILRSQQYGEAGTWDSITEQITGRPREFTLRMDTDPAHPGYVWFFGDSMNIHGQHSDTNILYKHHSSTGTTKKLFGIKKWWISNWDIKVSPSDTGIVYLRGIKLLTYNNNLIDKYKIIASNGGPPPTYIHCDMRDFNIYSHNGKDTIFVANDGGVSCGGNTGNLSNPAYEWKDISALNPDFKKHLNVTEFYAMDALQGNSDYIIGNCQDLSGFFRQDSKWYHTAGGDGGGIVIDTNDPRYIYYQDLQGPLHRSTNGGKSFDVIDGVLGKRLTIPMALDPDNPQNLYVGRKDLYLYQNARTNSGVADTIRWEGHEGGNTAKPKDITAIKFASDDRMYVGTDKQYKKDTVFTDVLWRSDNNGQTWTDISDSLAGVVFGYVNCIETHPSDDDKLWVGFTNVNAVCKLWYSGNAGQSYQEFDQGLPDSIPVWKIKFDKFANDLYIATDLGVFHRDLNNPSGEWQPYNYGSVNKVVTDIFIHEQGRIIAATYGNSMWETSTVCEEYSDTPIEITGYSIWQSPTRINQSIIIEDGGLLKVTADVYLSELSRIIVKRGGKLVVEGGRLSSSCKNGQWRGIELHGNSYQPQNDSFQGTVKVIDGGIIENALCGIRVYRITPPPNPEGNWEQDYNGGIVQCDSAFFINNEVAVEFKTYPTESDSYFHRTNFITDDRAYDGFEPEAFVGMLGMRGVDYKGCIFENKMTKPGLTYAEKGYGIYSVASRYTVDDYCLMDALDCEEPIITEFRNLNYGIHATDYRYNMAPTIRNSEFKYNKTGVYLGGINGAVVERNTFNTEPISGSPGEDIMGGLYLDHSTAYSVQENEFSVSQGSIGPLDNTVGLVVNEGGEQNNLIYNNYFERQEWALMAQGRNRNDGGSQGLRIKCNEFYLCENDICVADSTAAGIALLQGDSTNNVTAMAGNLFHIEGGVVDNDYDDIWNLGELIYYYYPNPVEGKALGRVKPRDKTEETVEDIEVPFDPAWTYEEGCPSQLDQVHDVGELRTEMDLTNQQIDSTENILSVLIDGGDTEELQSDVAYSIPSESAQLYSELMAESPYLSDTVISTAIEKEDVLPNVMIRDVMSANPNTAKSEKLMNKLDTRLDPLPDYMKQQILQGKDIFSIREETENALASYKSRKAKIFNELIRHYRHDTLNPAASADSIISMYRNENELWAKYALAFEYLDRDDSLNTFSTLDEIPVHFNLSAKQVAEHQNYTDLIALLYELEASGRTVFQVDSAEVAELYLLYENSQGGLKAGIRNVLQSIDTLSYNEPYLFPDQFKSSGVYHEDNDQKNSVKEVLLTVHPNPARDYIIIKCILPFEQKATIEIHDISGKPVTVLDVFNKTDQKIINTHNWNSGVYIARLKTNRQVIESVKFSVVK